ncbi:hypothetical protein QYF36_005194 [Acer negundo]|nr:hypothetical protein QYF36_005194 [Acer negundo]
MGCVVGLDIIRRGCWSCGVTIEATRCEGNVMVDKGGYRAIAFHHISYFVFELQISLRKRRSRYMFCLISFGFEEMEIRSLTEERRWIHI